MLRDAFSIKARLRWLHYLFRQLTKGAFVEASDTLLFSIMGDSISTYEGCNPEGFDVFYEGERKDATGVRSVSDTWWARVIDHFGGRLLSNGSFSGSMVEGAGFPAGESRRRVDALAADGRMPDVIMVFMGINDYGWGGARAQAYAGVRAVPSESYVEESSRCVAGRAETRALQGFSEAYASMLSRMRDRYPKASIWCCTLCPGRVSGEADPTFAWRFRGISLAAYNEAIRSAARKHGCRVVDFAAYGLDYDAVDGTHPSNAGMKQIAAMAIDAMASQGMSSSTGTLSLESAFSGFDLRSADWCEKDACVGCDCAKATGNAWFLVCEKDGRGAAQKARRQDEVE